MDSIDGSALVSTVSVVLAIIATVISIASGFSVSSRLKRADALLDLAQRQAELEQYGATSGSPDPRKPEKRKILPSEEAVTRYKDSLDNTQIIALLGRGRLAGLAAIGLAILSVGSFFLIPLEGWNLMGGYLGVMLLALGVPIVLGCWVVRGIRKRTKYLSYSERLFLLTRGAKGEQ